MAKRHKGQGTFVHESARATSADARARKGLGRFEMVSYLAAQTRPFVMAAERLWHGWRIVRPLERAAAAAAQARRAGTMAMRAAASESPARKNLSLAVSLARAVEPGRPRPARDGAETVSGRAQAQASREGVRDRRREDPGRTERPRHPGETRHADERRGARNNPGARMHEAVRRAIDAKWALIGASHSALGLTRAVHRTLEASWHAGLEPDARRAAREDAAIGNGSERRGREAAREGASASGASRRAASRDLMYRALARLGNTVGLLVSGLRGRGDAQGGRAAHSRGVVRPGGGGPGATALAATLRIPAVPSLVPVPALAGEPRGRISNPALPAPVVINSSPTLVLNRADSTLELEQRLLEVLRRHRDALYEQWEREREKRLRTQF
jgi:hypothetical protein